MTPNRIVLVLGGTRSGKSREAERIVAALAGDRPVTYLATASPDGDVALDERIALHRERRPGDWRTIEAAADPVTALLDVEGPVLLDALGPWAARLLPDGPDANTLVEALRTRQGDTVVVSEEVGLAVHPSTELGRRFVDVVGSLNQTVAAAADEVRLVIAGRVLLLPPEPPPIGGL